MTKRIGLVLLALVSIVLPIFASDTPDEYKLVGYGSETRGGLDGRIIKVTTLNATGEGSFTEALNAEGPRTIVFEVAGVIDLGKQQIDITEPYLTIAGQTAPSPGITLIRGGLTVRTHDVVIQHIRFRMGDAGAEKGEKYEPEISTYGAEAYNIVVDHCSVSWGVDENLSTSGPRLDGPEATSHNLTFSNNIIAEPLCYSVHSKDGNHGMGTLVHDNCTNVTIIGNYYAHNYERNPWYKGGCTGIVLNNLIYNPGKWAMRMGYVPKEWNDASDTNKTLNADPFSLQYNMKTWMVNNGGAGKDIVIDNVWDITQDKFKGKIHTMSPNSENVNRDWLIMLTQDKWCDVLKEAFEDPSNDNSSLDLTAYKSYGDKQKYAYAFIDKFLTNAVFHEDDGKARDTFMQEEGSLGWIVYSKIASIQETANITKKNITIAALGPNNTDGALVTNSYIKGFGGFMYKHYLQVMPYTQHPWTSCAFINYLSTTPEGYSAWAVDIGDYPTMPSINVDRTKFGHGTLATDYTFTQNNDGENVFPCLNDPSSDWWTGENGANAVIETPSYIVGEYDKVNSFINKVISSKN